MLGGSSVRPNEGRCVAEMNKPYPELNLGGVCDICGDNVAGDLSITGLSRVSGIIILRGM